jgi:Resolvase, N terminal domain
LWAGSGQPKISTSWSTIIYRGALDLLSLLADVEKHGITLESLTVPIDTSTAMGKAFYGIAAAFPCAMVLNNYSCLTGHAA